MEKWNLRYGQRRGGAEDGWRKEWREAWTEGRKPLLRYATDRESVVLVVAVLREDGRGVQVQEVGVARSVGGRRPPVATSSLIPDATVVVAREDEMVGARLHSEGSVWNA